MISLSNLVVKFKYIKAAVVGLFLLPFILIKVSLAETSMPGDYICPDGREVTDYNICLTPQGQMVNGSVYNQAQQQQSQQYNPNTFGQLDPTDYEYCVYLPVNLKYKSKGSDVLALQKYLLDRGFMDIEPTGYYGRATETAVKKFQYKNEIDATGFAGPMTREAVKELTCSERSFTKTVTAIKKTSPSNRIYRETDFTSQEFINSNSVSVQQNSSNSNSSNTSSVSGVSSKNSTTLPSTDSTKSVSGNQSGTYAKVSTPAAATNTNSTVLQTQNIISAPSLNFSNNSGNNTSGTIFSSSLSSQTLNQNNSKLTSVSGTFNTGTKNNLYFMYKSSAVSPAICIGLNNADCTKSANYQPITDGMTNELFEASNLASQWLITLHSHTNWGAKGSGVKVYLRDSPNDTAAIYTANVN